MTPFRKYGKQSTGPRTYGPRVRSYSFSPVSVVTVCSYRMKWLAVLTDSRIRPVAERVATASDPFRLLEDHTDTYIYINIYIYNEYVMGDSETVTCQIYEE